MNITKINSLKLEFLQNFGNIKLLGNKMLWRKDIKINKIIMSIKKLIIMQFISKFYSIILGLQQASFCGSQMCH